MLVELVPKSSASVVVVVVAAITVVVDEVFVVVKENVAPDGMIAKVVGLAVIRAVVERVVGSGQLRAAAGSQTHAFTPGPTLPKVVYQIKSISPFKFTSLRSNTIRTGIDIETISRITNSL